MATSSKRKLIIGPKPPKQIKKALLNPFQKTTSVMAPLVARSGQALNY